MEHDIDMEFKKEKNDIGIIKEKVDYFGEIKVKFEKCLKWCHRNKFYPFQLLLNECDIKVNDLDVFIASSYARPVSYEKLQKELFDFNLKQKFFDNRIELCEEKSRVIEIKNDIKTLEKRNFEYLGIFIAIITFLFASIPIFASTELTLNGSLLSILSLGIVLVLFINLLKVFQNTSKLNTNIWFGISLVAFLILFVLVKKGIL